MDEEDLRRLAAAGSTVEVSAGQVLIERGQPGTGLFVVLEGKLAVDSADGERELGPGSVVGERALLSSEGTRTARVRAVTDSVVLAVDRVEVDQLIDEDDGFAERLARG